ncbi:hypothetical protein B9G98_02355 [Wickerhamiella sorbophila]|uniref:Pentatricopeptide repeat-containing protein 5, mitochondrial n=1 Tax=Wickerhamiella sorbophila TaxID=45607 RepID=A0A2T0FIC5_9ASCO|nr:hypothetical protein B9G98_02355 [Wickerhamiella sorbophila]PRT54735.1 hypothetical protein B9G98_02355 [Wickerhamiella sorbophila]
MFSRRLFPVRFASSSVGSAARTTANTAKLATPDIAKESERSSAASINVNRVQDLLNKNDYSGATQVILSLSYKDLAPDALRKLSSYQTKVINHYAGLEAQELESAVPVLCDLQNKFIELGRRNLAASAQTMLLALRVGQPERAIEVWVQLLEAMARVSHLPLKELVSSPQISACALAALSAYFVSCSRRGIPVDASTALKLVPLKQVPISLAPLNNLRGQASSIDKQTLAIIREGLSELRRATTDYSNPEYLAVIAKANFQEAQTLYKEALVQQDLPEEVHAAFIRRFAETRQQDAAFKAWNTLVERFTAANKKPTVVSWRALLRAGSMSKPNGKEMVDQLWKEMEKAGIEPDEDCWCVRLESLIRSHNVDEAVKVYNEVEGSKKLGVFGMNIVATGLVNAKRFDEADELIAKAVESGAYKPNNVTFNALISAAVRARDSARAHRYLDDMAAAKILPDIVTYSQVLHALFEAQRTKGVAIADAVNSLLQEMKARKVAPNAQFYTILAHGIARSTESVSLSRRMFSIMQDAQLPLSVETFGALIDAEIKHGDFSRAKLYFDLMPKHGVPYSTANYAQMIAGALAIKDSATADKLLTAMLKRPRTQPNKYTYMFLLRNWQESDLEDPEVAALVQRTLELLSENQAALDYPLAQKVLSLGVRAGATPDLVSAAERVSAEEYDTKVANRRRRS